MEFNQLTDEEIEIIFLQMPTQHLLDLTLVSPRFNRIISGSTKLMENFVLVLQHVSKHPASRKYSRVELRYVEYGEVLQDLMTNHATNIRHLHLSSVISLYSTEAESSKVLYEFLCLAADNLESFRIENLARNKIHFDDFPPIPFKKLSFLYVDTDDVTRILNVFYATRLEEIFIKLKFQEDLTEKFARLFESQPNLKVLTLTGQIMNLMEDAVLGNVAFQLHELKISSTHPERPSPSLEFFNQFLQQQVSSLNTLKLKGFPLSKHQFELILSSQISNVTLEFFMVSWDRRLITENRSIRKITIDGCEAANNSYVRQFLRSCLNVKSIKFLNSTITMKTNLLLAYDLESLQALKLGSRVNTEVIAYQTLKVLKVGMTIDFDGDRDFVGMLVLANKHVEKVEVPHHLEHDLAFLSLIARFEMENQIFYV